VGWAGVDLFFVLSGFLISSLLFAEYKKTQEISLNRFFIRRGFKIYPAFWVMLLGSFLIARAYGMRFPRVLWLREILFIQNYRHGIWNHTWSLAVEEHFYIILPLLLLALTKFSKNRPDPFWSIPYLFCVLAPLTLAMRFASVEQASYRPEEFWKFMFLTHLRIDALFFGVVLGYFYHFRAGLIPNLLGNRWSRLALEGLTALLLSACFVFPMESPFMQSFGLTLVYLGFGGLLLLSLTARGQHQSLPALGVAFSKIGDLLAFLGKYSYSIYLWHVPVEIFALKGIRALSPAPLSAATMTYLYIAISIPIGILMARIVEFPVLLLRDRLFPQATHLVIPNRPETLRDAKLPLSEAAPV
jgi:peptidoglycan/LPS O-acetylase OafA/YrhL